MHVFTFSPFKAYLFTHVASASSNAKPDASQSEATFYNDDGFATVYRIFVSELELWLEPNQAINTRFKVLVRKKEISHKYLYCLLIVCLVFILLNMNTKCSRVDCCYRPRSVYDPPVNPYVSMCAFNGTSTSQRQIFLCLDI